MGTVETQKDGEYWCNLMEKTDPKLIEERLERWKKISKKIYKEEAGPIKPNEEWFKSEWKKMWFNRFILYMNGRIKGHIVTITGHEVYIGDQKELLEDEKYADQIAMRIRDILTHGGNWNDVSGMIALEYGVFKDGDAWRVWNKRYVEKKAKKIGLNLGIAEEDEIFLLKNLYYIPDFEKFVKRLQSKG